MISLTKYTSGEDANVVLYEKANSDLYTADARIARAKTLDGGVVIDHQGFSHGDRTIRVVAEVSEDEEAILKSMMENETVIYISTRDGCYSGCIKTMTGDNGQITLTFWIRGTA
jgi:adenine C2-methylase RlmN of 23S rRNA A2503 and tRNA A37